MHVIVFWWPFISNLAGIFGIYNSLRFALLTTAPPLESLAMSSSRAWFFSYRLVILVCSLTIDFHLIYRFFPYGSTSVSERSASSAKIYAVLWYSLLERYSSKSRLSCCFWDFVRNMACIIIWNYKLFFFLIHILNNSILISYYLLLLANKG